MKEFSSQKNKLEIDLTKAYKANDADKIASIKSRLNDLCGKQLAELFNNRHFEWIYEYKLINGIIRLVITEAKEVNAIAADEQANVQFEKGKSTSIPTCQEQNNEKTNVL